MLLIAQEEACTKRIAADRSHIVVPCAQPARAADAAARRARSGGFPRQFLLQ